MEFDRNRIYTVVNAEEAKAGSKGYFASSLDSLKEQVEEEGNLYEFKGLKPGAGVSCFVADYGVNAVFPLFYLVKEPEEKKFRPYKDTDEMIEDFKRRYNSYGGWSGKSNPMYNPLIWLKSDFGNKFLVSAFTNDSVKTDKGYCLLTEVFERHTYLDGTLCGISE